jgi:hypothetical protein
MKFKIKNSKIKINICVIPAEAGIQESDFSGFPLSWE